MLWLLPVSLPIRAATSAPLQDSRQGSPGPLHPRMHKMAAPPNDCFESRQLLETEVIRQSEANDAVQKSEILVISATSNTSVVIVLCWPVETRRALSETMAIEILL